ncbi:MAG: DNA-binding domain-containing protein [Bryobacteraceae bacterium]
MPRSLRATQRWLQDAIAAETPVSPAAARGRVKPSRTLAPAERVAIYRDMYLARLEEALRADYPLLAQFLGDELFGDLLRLYLSENPSRSYTLNRLGDRLPAFLAAVEGLPRPGFSAALARYELTLTEVFDEEHAEPIRTEALTGLRPDHLPALRFRTVPAFRLVALSHPVHLYPAPSSTRSKRTCLAIVRRDYTVSALELSRPAHSLLGALAAGATLGEALGRTRPANLGEWFRDWAEAGIFAAIERPARP